MHGEPGVQHKWELGEIALLAGDAHVPGGEQVPVLVVPEVDGGIRGQPQPAQVAWIRQGRVRERFDRLPGQWYRRRVAVGERDRQGLEQQIVLAAVVAGCGAARAARATSVCGEAGGEAARRTSRP